MSYAMDFIWLYGISYTLSIFIINVNIPFYGVYLLVSYVVCLMGLRVNSLARKHCAGALLQAHFIQCHDNEVI